MKITKSQLRKIIKEELETAMNEQAKPIEDLIKMGLKNAELPEDIKLKSFYHATPSDKVFLVPEEDEYFAFSKMYRPKRDRTGQLVFPEDKPLIISIEASKVGMPIGVLVDALRDKGLRSISKGAFTGPSYE